jgi:hypothetical protein
LDRSVRFSGLPILFDGQPVFRLQNKVRPERKRELMNASSLLTLTLSFDTTGATALPTHWLANLVERNRISTFQQHAPCMVHGRGNPIYSGGSIHDW